MITHQQLEIINRKTLRYPLHIAEKDYFLALVLQIITKSALKNTLIFKGGTALHHLYLEQYRFSEDLDFSANQQPVSLEEVRNIFVDTDYLSIKKDYLSGATVKIERLQYTGPLIQPNSLKVEIDFLQNVLLPPQTMKYGSSDFPVGKPPKPVSAPTPTLPRMKDKKTYVGGRDSVSTIMISEFLSPSPSHACPSIYGIRGRVGVGGDTVANRLTHKKVGRT